VLYNTDSTSTAGTFVYAPATRNVWTHLVVVFDAGERQVKIYANGVLTQAATRTATPWNATGPLHVGWARGMTTGVGQVADVRVWQRVVVPQDIWGADEDVATGVQAVTGLLAPTEVASWDFNGAAGQVCGSAFSDTYWAQSLDFGAGTCTDPYSPAQTAGYTGDDHDGNDGAVWLNHSPDGEAGTAGDGRGYAATAGPVLRTDQSFTVSAWVRLNRIDYETVVAQDGTVSSGFYLYYAPEDGGKWKLKVLPSATSADDTNATYAVAPAQDATTSWHHLVGVLDTGSRQIRLYVDGQVAATSALNTAWQPWQATGSLTVGRAIVGGSFTRFLAGTIDQVTVFAGAMSDREVSNLFAGS
jgi:hypothetical protein